MRATAIEGTNSNGSSSVVPCSGVPTTYLIDRKGKIRARYAGETDWMAAVNTKRIEALLAEGEAR